MALPTRRLRVPIFTLEGVPIEGAKVEIRLPRLSANTYGTLAPSTLVQYTDERGLAFFDLVPSSRAYSDQPYVITSWFGCDVTHNKIPFYMPDTDGSIEDIVDLAPVPIDPTEALRDEITKAKTEIEEKLRELEELIEQIKNQAGVILGNPLQVHNQNIKCVRGRTMVFNLGPRLDAQRRPIIYRAVTPGLVIEQNNARFTPPTTGPHLLMVVAESIGGLSDPAYLLLTAFEQRDVVEFSQDGIVIEAAPQGALDTTAPFFMPEATTSTTEFITLQRLRTLSISELRDVDLQGMVTGQALVRQADGTIRGATITGGGSPIDTSQFVTSSQLTTQVTSAVSSSVPTAVAAALPAAINAAVPTLLGTWLPANLPNILGQMSINVFSDVNLTGNDLDGQTLRFSGDTLINVAWPTVTGGGIDTSQFVTLSQLPTLVNDIVGEMPTATATHINDLQGVALEDAALGQGVMFDGANLVPTEVAPALRALPIDLVGNPTDGYQPYIFKAHENGKHFFYATNVAGEFRIRNAGFPYTYNQASETVSCKITNANPSGGANITITGESMVQFFPESPSSRIVAPGQTVEIIQFPPSIQAGTARDTWAVILL